MHIEEEKKSKSNKKVYHKARPFGMIRKPSNNTKITAKI